MGKPESTRRKTKVYKDARLHRLIAEVTANGFVVARKGMPTFMCYKKENGKTVVAFVFLRRTLKKKLEEYENPMRGFQKSQRAMIQILKEAGYNVFLS